LASPIPAHGKTQNLQPPPFVQFLSPPLAHHRSSYPRRSLTLNSTNPSRRPTPLAAATHHRPTALTSNASSRRLSPFVVLCCPLVTSVFKPSGRRFAAPCLALACSLHFSTSPPSSPDSSDTTHEHTISLFSGAHQPSSAAVPFSSRPVPFQESCGPSDSGW
ncbi:hypothetical protein PIB30_063805, partial [Stylosanthes scabra]|nr:hypothetical protein [Stylosanthes scabra]